MGAAPPAPSTEQEQLAAGTAPRAGLAVAQTDGRGSGVPRGTDKCWLRGASSGVWRCVSRRVTNSSTVVLVLTAHRMRDAPELLDRFQQNTIIKFI